MRYLSSPTRDRTRTPLQWKHRVLATGLPGKSLDGVIDSADLKGSFPGFQCGKLRINPNCIAELPKGSEINGTSYLESRDESGC